MSGGPLIKVKDEEVIIFGIISSSSMLPFLRGFQDFMRGYLIKGWGGFFPIVRNI